MGGKVSFSWMSRLLAGIILAAVLAGCGGLGLSTPEPVELTFSYLEGAADYPPLVEAFQNLHPNITINLKAVSNSGSNRPDFDTWVPESDVVRLPTTQIGGDLVDSFLPIDTMISTNQQFPQDDLFSGSLDALKYDGKLVGLPAGINPFVVYYLPKKFAAAGVQPPASGWSLEDFVSTAKALHNPDAALIGTDRYAYGFCTHPLFSDSALFSYIFGGRLFDSLVQATHPTLNDPGNVAALTWYASLKTDLDLVPPGNTPRDVGMLLYRNSCGMWIDWLDKSSFGPEGAPEAEPLPLPHQAAEFDIAVQDGYFILAKGEHPDEAFLWASYLMQQQGASGLLIPPVKKAIDTPEYAARTSPAILNLARSLPEQTVILSLDIVRSERFGNVLGYFGAAAQKVFNGESSAQMALDEAQLQAEQTFK